MYMYIYVFMNLNNTYMYYYDLNNGFILTYKLGYCLFNLI